MLRSPFALAAVLFTFAAFAAVRALADPIPGAACATNQQYQLSGGPELAGSGHLLVCESGTWKGVLSFNSLGQVTQIGNLSCSNGQLFGFNGTTWSCSTSVTANPDTLDFTEFKDAMALDASTSIAGSGTNELAITHTGSANALRITNTGTGNSLLVEDAASTDTTPFVIDAAGQVGIGTSSPSYKLDVRSSGSSHNIYAQNDGNGAALYAYNTGAQFAIHALSASGHGIYAQTNGNGMSALYGYQNGATGTGVYAHAQAPGGNAFLGYHASSGYYCYIGNAGFYSIACSGPTSGVSDLRLKKDIRGLPDAEGLAAVMKLRPVIYRWKDRRKSDHDEYGFIAQEVEQVLPLLVHEMKLGPEVRQESEPEVIKTLNYERIVAPLVKAVQELKAENDRRAQDVRLLREEFEAYKKAHP